MFIAGLFDVSMPKHSKDLLSDTLHFDIHVFRNRKGVLHSYSYYAITLFWCYYVWNFQFPVWRWSFFHWAEIIALFGWRRCNMWFWLPSQLCIDKFYDKSHANSFQCHTGIGFLLFIEILICDFISLNSKLISSKLEFCAVKIFQLDWLSFYRSNNGPFTRVLMVRIALRPIVDIGEVREG